jgi:hypothetical protein
MTVFYDCIEVTLMLSTEMAMFWDETLTEEDCYLMWLGLV